MSEELRIEALVRLAQDVEISDDEGIGTGFRMQIVNGKLVMVMELGDDQGQFYVHVHVSRVVPVEQKFGYGGAWADDEQRKRYGRRWWTRKTAEPFMVGMHGAELRVGDSVTPRGKSDAPMKLAGLVGEVIDLYPDSNQVRVKFPTVSPDGSWPLDPAFLVKIEEQS